MTNPFDTFAINSNKHFFKAAGSSVILTPAGGQGKTVAAILGSETMDWDTGSDGLDKKVYERSCQFQVTEAVNVVKGSLVTAEGRSYTINEPITADAAMITVRLVRDVDVRRAGTQRFKESR